MAKLKGIASALAGTAAKTMTSCKFTTKKAAEAAAKKSGNTTAAQARAANSAKVTAYGSRSITDLSIRRVNSVGSGDLSVEIRFKCSIRQAQVKEFELDIEQYSTATKTWTQLDNSTKKLDHTSFANGYYTYVFDAPNQVDISILSVRAKPNPATVERTAYYYTVEKKTSGSGKNKKTWYRLKKNAVKETKNYFSADYSGFKYLSPAPALADSDDEAAKLRVKAPEKPANPTAELQSNGTVKVNFDAIDRETADRCRLVYRCMDGAYETPVASMSGKLDTPGQTYFVDNGAEPGHEYRYYVRAFNDRTAEGVYSPEPSLPADLSEPLKTAPVEVDSLSAEGYGPSGVKVSFTYPAWAYFPALEEARVYYADDYETLITNQTSCDSASVTLGMGIMSVIITGLESGKTWYFAPWFKTGSDALQERFCESVVSCPIATVPDPPTMLTTAMAAHVGSTLTVEWSHNSEDGSAQEQAELNIEIEHADGTTATETVSVGVDESYDLYFDPAKYTDLSTVTITVRTKGASNEWSDYGESLSLTVYARPSAYMVIQNAESGGIEGLEVKSLPLTLDLSVGSGSGTISQHVVQWRVTIMAKKAFTYTDIYGNESRVAEGELVSNITLDRNEEGFTEPTYTMRIPATDAIFVNQGDYTATVNALMDSGLEAEPFSVDFTCSFEGGLGLPTAIIMPNFDWSTRVYPMLTEAREIASGEDYVIDNGVIELAAISEGEYTLEVTYVSDDGETRTLTREWDGSETGFIVDEMGTWQSITSVSYTDGTTTRSLTGSAYNYPALVEDVTLSVYRVNADGSMDEICSEFPNGIGIFCVDRHPVFGEMTYRVVANSLATDEISACDVTSDNNWDGILIQWDETEYSTTEPVDTDEDIASYAFEWVRLPWNVAVKQSSSKDVAYKKYQGRKHPVALYGTQVGESGSWSCSIVKYEEDLELSQLRRLSSWMGGCWVRDSSGLSYPANVDVSIDWSYNTAEITVSLEVTRTDG